jgi:hypothetical protein
MYMPASVRFFCLIAPDAHEWGPVSRRFLAAVANKHEVRALPIGGHFLGFEKLAGYEAWAPLVDLFAGDVDEDYINVVCAPSGLDLGRAVTDQSVAPREAFEGLPAIATHGARSSGAIVYKPKTALETLWTDGVPNVAITSPAAWDDELQALSKYNLTVRVPDGASPEDLAAFLGKMKKTETTLALEALKKEATRG